MMRKILADDNYALMLEEHYNSLAKEHIRRFEVVPNRDAFLMEIDVLGDGFFAHFPVGLSFTGKDGDLWVQAIRNAEAFIARATPFVKQLEGEEES